MSETPETPEQPELVRRYADRDPGRSGAVYLWRRLRNWPRKWWTLHVTVPGRKRAWAKQQRRRDQGQPPA